MITWKLIGFHQMDVTELYAYLALRSEVFIVEQNCPYQDLDGLDAQAQHLLAFDGERPVACARLFAPGIVYTEASIGRVITKPSHRSQSLGKELMKRSIEILVQQFNNPPIQIGAQAYLERFYEGFGFKRIGDIYLEDNIPHIKMLRHPM
ncbi:MAG TPA: GNAT family N-acetyltransferase [Luteibaculaceae bacterium]|nr:GNAT family N-acetyltransferase [Luteibaculaceae bacterium]